MHAVLRSEDNEKGVLFFKAKTYFQAIKESLQWKVLWLELELYGPKTQIKQKMYEEENRKNNPIVQVSLSCTLKWAFLKLYTTNLVIICVSPQNQNVQNFFHVESGQSALHPVAQKK